MKTSVLIENLSKEDLAVKTHRPFAQFLKWAFFSGVYLFAIIMAFGVRDDITLKLGEPLFLAEISSLLALALTVGVSAIILSYPDRYQKNHILLLPLLPLIAFIAVLWLQANASHSVTSNLEGELGCFICLCLAAMGPAALMFRSLIRNASTSPRLASALAVLAAFCFGAIAVRLIEKVDSVTHIITIHYLPLIALSAIGLMVGRKWLKW